MRKLIYILCCLLILLHTINNDGSIITTLNKNDPAPIFSSAYPYSYLYQHEKEYYKRRTDYFDPQFFSFAVSPFYQRASVGTDIHQRKAQLGDLTGKWNMIAVLPFGTYERPPIDRFNIDPNQCVFNQADQIAQGLFSCINEQFVDTSTTPPVQLPIPDELQSTKGLLSLQRFPEQFFGFFSVPIKYRKLGVRFDASIRFCGDFGFSFQTGVADISQQARYLDQTTTPTQCIPIPCENTAASAATCSTNTDPQINCLNPFANCRVSNAKWRCIVDCVHTELMNKLGLIARNTGTNLCDFNKTSIEDIHAEVWWRHAYDISPNYLDGCWTPFFFIPFASLGASFPTGEQKIQNQPMSLPFGNNGHFAVRANAGFTLDFYDTIELGMHSGVTHFFPKTFNQFRMPNNCAQNGIIPFVTTASVQPGQTWHVGLLMNAYRFLNCFSSHVEYLYVSHIKDKITLRKCDQKCPVVRDQNVFNDNPPPPNPNDNFINLNNFSSCVEPAPTCNEPGFFKPEQLECLSPWNQHLLNVSVNLDVSPNFTIGGIIQIPLARRNAYKSTTYMVSCVITY